MNIRINRASSVPVRQQVAEQVLLLIVTGILKPGRRMPGVRELARRLKIHHNTVSEAYQELVRRHWLVRHKGSHLTVRGTQEGIPLLLEWTHGSGYVDFLALDLSASPFDAWNGIGR